jgi:inner membrane protein
MVIPALFVNGLVNDRTRRAADVVKEISSHVGGPQTFLGPTLAIPYVLTVHGEGELPKRGVFLVFPAHASAVIKTATEERHRSLFRVPVFQADLNLDADFDLSGVTAQAPMSAVLDWSNAEIVVGVRRAGRRDIDDRQGQHHPGARRGCREPDHWRESESTEDAISLRRKGGRYCDAGCAISCFVRASIFRR